MIIYTHKQKIGDYMIKRRFALLPVEIDEQRNAWLQYVYQVSKVQHGGAYAAIKTFLTEKEAKDYTQKLNEKASSSKGRYS